MLTTKRKNCGRHRADGNNTGKTQRTSTGTLQTFPSPGKRGMLEADPYSLVAKATNIHKVVRRGHTSCGNPSAKNCPTSRINQHGAGYYVISRGKIFTVIAVSDLSYGVPLATSRDGTTKPTPDGMETKPSRFRPSNRQCTGV